ncbi:MAG: cysteine desulfurase [Oscillospiraceae bacterium]|nr:cysteine desulfurase [Oscillospiraceae bacterium]
MKVYFDNSATTRVCPEAIEAAVRAMGEDFGNPSSTHALGRESRAMLERARADVAGALSASPREIFFTSGGTESDNWALLGAAELMRHKGRHIITTAVEHDAVLKTAARLKDKGWEITYLKPDGATGRVSAESVGRALRDDTALVSVMLVNNETGAINPIREIADVIKGRGSGALLHTDAVQAFCKIPVSPKTLGVDLMTVSSHKIHGPKGAGALYIKDGMRFPPLMTGGGQEGGYRSGTEPIPAICGFAAAAAKGFAALSENEARMREIRSRIVENLQAALPDIRFIGAGDAPHILSLSLPGYRSEVLMNCLDADGICVSKSSACKKGGRSHVLEAMGLPHDVTDGAIRVSLCAESTAEEADYFCERLTAAAGRLKKR